MKPPPHARRRKPIAERYQTLIAGSILIGLIAITVAAIGYFFPAQSDKPRASLSLQEVRR